MALKTRLTELQKVLGLSDRAFAAKLGLSSSHWNKIKRGERPVEGKLYEGVLRAFPELRELVLEDIAGGAEEVTAA